MIATPPSVPSWVQATVSSPPIRHPRPSLTRLIQGWRPALSGSVMRPRPHCLTHGETVRSAAGVRSIRCRFHEHAEVSARPPRAVALPLPAASSSPGRSRGAGDLLWLGDEQLWRCDQSLATRGQEHAGPRRRAAVHCWQVGSGAARNSPASRRTSNPGCADHTSPGGRGYGTVFFRSARSRTSAG